MAYDGPVAVDEGGGGTRTEHFDVAICGGGLAGLCLARQLRLEQPGLAVAVLDRRRRPLPRVAFKVGESTVELGALYLSDTLRLGELLRDHVPKLGLRFFYGDGRGAFADRPEVGLADFPAVPTWQLERGRFEEALRNLLARDGVRLYEGVRVEPPQLASDGPHSVRARAADDTVTELSCRWLVDASGRRRLLQRQLGHDRPSRSTGSAAWFRIDRRWRVDDLVPDRERAWHARVPGGRRFHSTVHLCGRGYWIWVIPLAGEATSVGIVADERFHPFSAYNTRARARAWLEEREPAVAALLDGPLLDFRTMRRYARASARVFSARRWGCIGEAAVFPDPYYSPGIDQIAYANILLADLIARDVRGALEPTRVDEYSRALIGLNRFQTRAIHRGYRYLGDALVNTARFVWDVAVAWGYHCPQVLHRVFVDDTKKAALHGAAPMSFFLLAETVHRLLSAWVEARERRGGRLRVVFLDYLAIPWLRAHRRAGLSRCPDLPALVARHRSTLERLEELAQALLLLAVEDVHPEALPRLAGRDWLDTRQLRLDPSTWQASGMLAAPPGRSFRPLHRALRSHLVGPD